MGVFTENTSENNCFAWRKHLVRSAWEYTTPCMFTAHSDALWQFWKPGFTPGTPLSWEGAGHPAHGPLLALLKIAELESL